jgi:cytoskeleton protein RodZ
MADPNDNAATPPRSSLPPGEQLRLTREERGMTLTDVAAKLRLKEQLLADLEEGNTQRLPPAAFVAGYTRSYARLLGLDGDKLLAAAGKSTSRNAAPALYTTQSGERNDAENQPWVAVVTWLLAISLLILVIIWWVRESETIIEDISSQDEASELSDVRDFVPTPEPAVTAAAVTTTDEAIPPPPAPAATVPPGVSTQAGTTTAPAVSAPPVTTTKPAAADASVVVADIAADEPLPQEGTLKMVFNNDCWTVVHDANGKRLVFDTVRQGRTLEFTGPAPFKVSLGYALGIEVYYNGERFDYSQFISRRMATFFVGESSSEVTP